MIVSRLELENWRNFRKVDVQLGYRVFIIGPNASGKSNFLDVFRFLRDIVKDGGGLQAALKARGGVSKIRCLSARRDPDVRIAIHLADGPGKPDKWVYEISIKQEQRGHRRSLIGRERVLGGNEQLLLRPVDEDKDDPDRKLQTHLEQINANQQFREIHAFLNSVSYMHMIPQLLRYPAAFSSYKIPGDPFGGFLLDQIAETSKKTREARLKKINKALLKAVPQFSKLTQTTDDRGIPHLEAIYEHWRVHGAKQMEDQFSDGTLRLIGLLWSLLDSDSLLLLEEPELSLHSQLVSLIPSLMHRIQTKRRRQVMLSTHSADLLQDPGIGGNEVLLLIPSSEGTEVKATSDIDEIRFLLESGMSVAEAALPRTAPAAEMQTDFLDALE